MWFGKRSKNTIYNLDRKKTETNARELFASNENKNGQFVPLNKMACHKMWVWVI